MYAQYRAEEEQTRSEKQAQTQQEREMGAEMCDFYTWNVLRYEVRHLITLHALYALGGIC